MQQPGTEEKYKIVTANEQPKQKRGKWTELREQELLRKYNEFQPFAQKKGQAEHAWAEILKAVNLKDGNEEPVKYHSAVGRIGEIFRRFADSGTEKGSSSKTKVNHYTSDLEDLAFKAKAAKDAYEEGKREEKRPQQGRLTQRDVNELKMRQYAINGMNSKKRSTISTENVDNAKRPKTAENSEKNAAEEVGMGTNFVDSEEDDEEETRRRSLKFLQNRQKHNDEILQIQRERLAVEKGILNTLEAILHKMK